MTTTRRSLVAANWKMHFTTGEARDTCTQLLARLRAPLAEVVVFPSAPLLTAVSRVLSETELAWGGQDLHPEARGAHTGDVSGLQLADVGCTWVLCGHSERRRDHGESDQLVGEKARAAREHGLIPMICLGETAEERRQGETLAVLERQLQAALRHRPEPFALAYEPVWAIGTGETATPETAQEAHAFLREALADLIGPEAASARRILYGGSVNPDNAAEIHAREDIDGFLVGGASLDPKKFSAIIGVCGSHS